MNASGFSGPSAVAAGRILSAIEAADLAMLERELDQAQAPVGRPLPAGSAECAELLDAIAGRMRQSIEEMKRGRSSRLDGSVVCVTLLRHLAGRAA